MLRQSVDRFAVTGNPRRSQYRLLLVFQLVEKTAVVTEDRKRVEHGAIRKYNVFRYYTALILGFIKFSTPLKPGYGYRKLPEETNAFGHKKIKLRLRYDCGIAGGIVVRRTNYRIPRSQRVQQHG